MTIPPFIVRENPSTSQLIFPGCLSAQMGWICDLKLVYVVYDRSYDASSRVLQHHHQRTIWLLGDPFIVDYWYNTVSLKNYAQFKRTSHWWIDFVQLYARQSWHCYHYQSRKGYALAWLFIEHSFAEKIPRVNWYGRSEFRQLYSPNKDASSRSAKSNFLLEKLQKVACNWRITWLTAVLESMIYPTSRQCLRQLEKNSFGAIICYVASNRY